MKITNLDLNKPFKNPLNFADNFKEFFVEAKDTGYDFYVWNDNNDEIYIDPYNGKYSIFHLKESSRAVAEVKTIYDVVLCTFPDGMTIFEYLTGEKPIVEE